MRFIALFVLTVLSPTCFASSLRGDSDISELPSQIKAPELGLSLIADYEHPIKDVVLVYLVNRTGKDIQLRGEDLTTALLLEYQDSKGTWKRAIPRSGSHGCGFVSPMIVHNNRFLTAVGFQSSEGELVPIRFRLSGENPNLVSNVGRGLIDLKQAKLAETDFLAVMSGDFTLVSDVALGKLPVMKTEDLISSPRYHAIMLLGRGAFDRTKSVGVLRKIIRSNDKLYAEIATSFLGEPINQAKESKKRR
jgi:hypothetical protein